MKFKELVTKYDVGDKILHTYHAPGLVERQEEVLIIQSINVRYGLVAKPTRLDYSIDYNCVREDGMNTSHGPIFSFTEGGWDEKYVSLIK